APLDESQKAEGTAALLASEEGKAMATSIFDHWIRQGEEKGREQGQTEGARHSLQLLLEEKFGPLSPDVIKRRGSMSDDESDQTVRAAVRANSLRELGLENGNGT